jgi:hypothetical protein
MFFTEIIVRECREILIEEGHSIPSRGLQGRKKPLVKNSFPKGFVICRTAHVKDLPGWAFARGSDWAGRGRCRSGRLEKEKGG